LAPPGRSTVATLPRKTPKTFLRSHVSLLSPFFFFRRVFTGPVVNFFGCTQENLLLLTPCNTRKLSAVSFHHVIWGGDSPTFCCVFYFSKPPQFQNLPVLKVFFRFVSYLISRIFSTLHMCSSLGLQISADSVITFRPQTWFPLLFSIILLSRSALRPEKA